MSQRFSLSLLLVLALVSTGIGCTKSSNTGDQKNDPADAGTVDGGDEVDAGDGKCRAHDHCPASQYCDFATGDCLDAKPCSPNPDIGDLTGMTGCEYQPDEAIDYCWRGSCYCDVDRNGGTCLPRVTKCGSCTSDVECGNDPTWYDVPAKCVNFEPEGKPASKVCLPAPTAVQKCPSGYLRTNDPRYSDYCVPAGGYCGAPGACTADDECDPESANPICQVSPGGFCVPACTFDWRMGSSTCPNGQVCHADPRLFQPSTNPNFGNGKCDQPCDIEGGYVCPDGLECVADGQTQQKRCRPPPPSCIRDEDCPPDAATFTTGYCNLQTLKCELSCRKASHCKTGYGCVDEQCVEKTCTEQGGANFACVRGDFCCGEAGGPNCPTGVSQGACYQSSNPPWCGTCNAEGKFFAINDGVKRPDESFCAGGKQWHSCDVNGPKSQCPQNWQCAENPSFCETDADCGPEGSCGDIQFQPPGFDQAINTKACLCNDAAKDWTKMCPGTASSCAKDMDGKPTICLAGWCDMRFCAPPAMP